MSDTPNRDVELFTAAIHLPAAERISYIEQACGADTELRQEVLELLRLHDSAGDFLEQSPQVSDWEALGEAPGGPRLGDRIGRYKLLQQIGEGGCGVVYLAEQEEPVRRQVALKVIKPGMDTRSVIARFEAERQALALMDHPSIAKVLDAGATVSGRPYFVMELVKGSKITDYCDQNSLPTRERLKLFIQVCNAVQHAHQKGIIHRDIKPSNILVSTVGRGEALPVVIDFGIAKATTNQLLTDKTLFTAFEMLIGTPAYMSPEQTELTKVDLDTRTDIYSLGVLLYELLTDSTPFSTRELLKLGLDEARRVIREQEPVRPSTRLSKLTKADLTVIAQRRRAEAPMLIRAVRGDLDWIVMRALEKDRRRRYQTSTGLALDVQRFLDNEPVLARPPNALYKFHKLVSRNRLLFSAIAIIATLLVLSLVIISVSFARERQAHREADAALQQAEADKVKAQTEAAKSEQVTQFLEDMLQGVGPSYALGKDTTMLKEILDRTALRVSMEMTNQPEIEIQLRTLIARVYLEIGEYGRAAEMQRATLAIDRKLFGPESTEAAAALNDLGLTYARDVKPAAAILVYEEALAIRRHFYGNDDTNVAATLNNLGEMYAQEGQINQAESAVREALAIREKWFGTNSPETAYSLRSLCIILGDQGKWAESENMAQQVLAIRRSKIGPEDPLVATSLGDLAWVEGSLGRQDQAEKLERDALAIRIKLFGHMHQDVAKSLYLVGDRLRQQGKFDDALNYLNQALDIQLKLHGVNHPNTLDTLHSLGLTFEAKGDLEDAEKAYRQAVTGWKEFGQTDIPQAVSAFNSLVRVLVARKKPGAAEEVLDEMLTPAMMGRPAAGDLLFARAALKVRRGAWLEAAADIAIEHQLEPDKHELFPELAGLYIKGNNAPAYEQLRQSLIARFAGTTDFYTADQVAKACLFRPPAASDLPVLNRLADLPVTLGAADTGAMPFFENCKSLSEYRQGHFAGAAAWARKTIASSRSNAYGQAYGILAMADWELGEKAAARDALAKGDSFEPAVLPQSIVESPGDDGWEAWLYARMQLDEATALIQPPAKAPTPFGGASGNAAGNRDR